MPVWILPMGIYFNSVYVSAQFILFLTCVSFVCSFRVWFVRISFRVFVSLNWRTKRTIQESKETITRTKPKRTENEKRKNDIRKRNELKTQTIRNICYLKRSRIGSKCLWIVHSWLPLRFSLMLCNRRYLIICEYLTLLGVICALDLPPQPTDVFFRAMQMWTKTRIYQSGHQKPTMPNGKW